MPISCLRYTLKAHNYLPLIQTYSLQLLLTLLILLLPFDIPQSSSIRYRTCLYSIQLENYMTLIFISSRYSKI